MNKKKPEMITKTKTNTKMITKTKRNTNAKTRMKFTSGEAVEEMSVFSNFKTFQSCFTVMSSASCFDRDAIPLGLLMRETPKIFMNE